MNKILLSVNALIFIRLPLLLLALRMCLPAAYAVQCEHEISIEWNSGFVGSIRITNTDDEVIDGWSVVWQYHDALIDTSWSAELSGDNPYTAKNLGWNRYVYPGESIEFGFVGTKLAPGQEFESPIFFGELCAETPTPTPVIIPPPTLEVTPSPEPQLCGDSWENLSVTGLKGKDQIFVSWNAGWGYPSFWTGNTQIEGRHFGYCGSPSNFPSSGGVEIIDSAGYECLLESPDTFIYEVSCSERRSTYTPSPSILPTSY